MQFVALYFYKARYQNKISQHFQWHTSNPKISKVSLQFQELHSSPPPPTMLPSVFAFFPSFRLYSPYPTMAPDLLPSLLTNIFAGVTTAIKSGTICQGNLKSCQNTKVFGDHCTCTGTAFTLEGGTDPFHPSNQFFYKLGVSFLCRKLYLAIFSYGWPNLGLF